MSSHLTLLRSVLRRLKSHRPTVSLQFEDYPLDPPLEIPPLHLQKGDRLALCGDSITEQRLYSVLIECYLHACRPDLEVSVRQYGWSGEKSGEFLQRMAADVLRFHPTVATTLYGMNDFFYIPYDEEIAASYVHFHRKIIENFRHSGCRVLLGSPTIIDTVPEWVKTAKGSKYDLNLSLCRFRNHALHLAQEEKISFADHFLPMLKLDFTSKKLHGPHFKLAGKDGVHPDWAGQLVIAWVFLKNLGLDGDLGTIILNETDGTATAPHGHEILTQSSGVIRLRSERLPFCPGPGPTDVSDSLRAGMALVPFDDELNRFLLRIHSPRAAVYQITWGHETRDYTAQEISSGINLAKDFPENPLVPAFMKLWHAVVSKQAFETRQHKEMLVARDGTPEREAAFRLSEATRTRYLHAIHAARQPVDHEILIQPLQASQAHPGREAS